MICQNCGAESDIVVVGTSPHCPACADSANETRHEVRLSHEGQVLALNINHLGLRWDYLRERVLREHYPPTAEEPTETRSWWRRLLALDRSEPKVRP